MPTGPIDETGTTHGETPRDPPNVELPKTPNVIILSDKPAIPVIPLWAKVSATLAVVCALAIGLNYGWNSIIVKRDGSDGHRPESPNDRDRDPDEKPSDPSKLGRSDFDGYRSKNEYARAFDILQSNPEALPDAQQLRLELQRDWRTYADNLFIKAAQCR